MAVVVHLDPVIGTDGAQRMLEMRAAFGPHGLYSDEGNPDRYAPELPERYDSIRNYLSDQGVDDDPAELRLVRETYSYRDELMLPGIEEFRDNPAFVTAARVVHSAPIVEPAIVFANMYLPGQELAFHTDVPEFRGVSRRTT